MIQPELVASDPALEPVTIRFDPGPAYAERARNWQGIPGIEHAVDGRLWATWYTGGRTEDPHNHVVLVTSDDDGLNWSEPVLAIAPPGDIRASDPVLWHDPMGRLWLFWMQTAHCGCTFDGRGGVWAIRCPDATVPRPAWTAPFRVANGIMMNKPTVLSTGEWLLPTAVWSHAAPYRLHLPDEAYANVTVSRDQGATFSLLGSADVPLRGPDEHMIVERRDGSLWMLVRRKDGIGEAISRDRGVTWKAAPGVVIPGPGSRFHIRRLRSGRLLLINHVNFTGRSHLTALLSEDDGASWPHRLLLDERHNISYPDAVQTPSGELLVIYDHDRTGDAEILLQRFTEADIMENRCPGSPSGRLQVISRIERPMIGSRRELPIDDGLIDQLEDAVFRGHAESQRNDFGAKDRPSVHAPLAGGQVSLKPLRFEGSRLFVHAATSAAGSLRVQIEDSSGKPIEGFALADCHAKNGNGSEHEVQWHHGSDVGALAGRLVRLRFALTDAHLYGVRFDGMEVRERVEG